MQEPTTTRRKFIQSIGLLSIGFSMLDLACDRKTDDNETITEPAMRTDPVDGDRIDSWLQVLEDGRIKILTGKIELGQGIMTAIMQIAAEELNTCMNLIEIHVAETGYTPDEGYTLGSMSIETSGMAVRNAAACARERLLELAADKLGLGKATLSLEDAMISGSGKSIAIQELLAGQQLTQTVTLPETIFAKTVRKYVGKPLIRKDIEDILVAKTYFLHDLRFPGMVHARMIRPPAHGAKLASVDKLAISKLEGLQKAVQIGSFLGVIAPEEFQAIKLANQIKTLLKWEMGSPLPASEPLPGHLKSLPAASETDRETEHWRERIISTSAIVHRASYFKPYIMHAANGPSCAIALFKAGKLWVWTHCQGVYPLRDALAGLLDMLPQNIHVKGVPGSGCYGHNGADDVAAEAALLAVNYPGKHIRLQWMRDEENGWEPYSTAMIMELAAGLDDSGRIRGWKYDLWSDVHGTRPGGDAANLLPAWYIDKGYSPPESGFRGGATRNAEPYYRIEHMKLQSHIFTGPLRRSSIRGLGAYANIFAIESFMDELAVKAGMDPISFRLRHLEDSRASYCLKLLVKNTKNVTVGKDGGLGYAFSRYKNSAAYCAVAALVSINRQNGKVSVKKLWAVVDAGETINSDGLKNQIEGGMIQSVSWGLMESVTFDATHITSLNWASYPILRFNDAPDTDVEVIDRVDERPLGAGEAAQGPTIAALVNAVYNATGIRIRDLPINPDLLRRPSQTASIHNNT
ncbi:molybdopterin-dependent oxidoreductase [Olivibacter sp. 47]|uniref:xanthine dehydrogenase family protein molybdopterin-binding subunit n=1 Tax=unclassified Olivibacter TaxID=2632301 RepID=UPI001AEF941A|nr:MULTISPECIES: molybdopterin cofactor-binding domain-containing protein [unclassified Olivibacter]MDM8175900.1 molybdopterin-dependent oxidoreductase [Olivibacter sp. 47]